LEDRRHPEESRGLPGGQASDRGEAFWIDRASRPTQANPLHPSPRQAGPHAFLNPRPLEPRDRPEDMHLELAGWRRGVKSLLSQEPGQIWIEDKHRPPPFGNGL
jgi:hypothetical protein